MPNDSESKLVTGKSYSREQLRELGIYLPGEKDANDKRNKYSAKPTIVDGIRFASRLEAKRYGQLKLLENRGMVTELQLQVPYTFMVNGRVLKTQSGRDYKYLADFVYKVKGKVIVEDSKGFKTQEYKTKKMLMSHVNDISILETNKY